MKVIVYVEGPSDRDGLTALLQPLINEQMEKGISISFVQAKEKDRKKYLIQDLPKAAVNILKNDPAATIVALPDLHPVDKGFPHKTCDELIAGVQKEFLLALQEKGIADERFHSRFRVFCMKYELEALILAASEELRQLLGLRRLDRTWAENVEDQNNANPPKEVVEKVFRSAGEYYEGTLHAPLILGEASYKAVVERCPQCFAPFVKFLEDLPPVHE